LTSVILRCGKRFGAGDCLSLFVQNSNFAEGADDHYEVHPTSAQNVCSKFQQLTSKPLATKRPAAVPEDGVPSGRVHFSAAGTPLFA